MYSKLFTIKDVDFKSDYYGSETYIDNWPMLYILENGVNAYVGQTNSITQRMSQHKLAESKQQFTKAHFIFYNKFNQSATFDYESQLIALMSADAKFKLTNRNAGLAGLNYFDKDKYDEDFKQLWKELQSKGLAQKTIEELQRSDLFKYSPFKQLSTQQRELVSEITDNLRRSLNRKIIVEGMPGSGKTILAIYLIKLLKESPEFRNLKIALVVPPASLRKTIKSVFKTLNGLSQSYVIGPNEVINQDYDIVLVDESHRLKMRKNLASYTSYDAVCEQLNLPNTATQLDWILKKTKCAIFFYDKNQIIFPQGLEVHKLINDNPRDIRSFAQYTLYSQMRCLGGIDYLEDLEKLLHSTLAKPVRHSDYELALVDDFASFEELFEEKVMEEKLTRMIAGYAWEWKSKDDKSQYDIVIDESKRQWNSTLENWVNSPNAVNEVGCIHSIQGYDLNYGFVIIGNDLQYNPSTQKIIVNRDSYFDKYGKNNTTPETLEEYIKNIYYVLLTRGVRGTYIYVCNEELKTYLQKLIPTYKKEFDYSTTQNNGLIAAKKQPIYINKEGKYEHN